MNEQYRNELKYICSKAELKMLEYKIRHLLRPDSYTNEKGEYTIRSVYFDDYQKSCLFDNENGIDPREKFRIRIYNCSKERISLEKKKKYQSMTSKERCIIDYDTCMKMVRGESISGQLGQNSLLDEWILARESRLLKPVMLGEYVRKPYIYMSGNVRITFDMNIMASHYCDGLFDRKIPKISILPSGYHVLEIKYDDFIPNVIYRIIDEGHLKQSTFSKFYLGCKTLEGRLENVI